ncbi:hypothetical protein [Halosolutus gelatinilyticus]|uniref:hypothetical protein n=1 Tax=Halosolutus gelatinilyticus TaxID=2931975 RepID=UPI001FF526DC|nr:hypothetical protein [Halosolutus gelatinilyticus]
MTDPLERFRRPEYTGENRCWPCTVVNGVLVAIVAGALAILDRRTAAAVAAVVGAVAIALRGYVVPYTPQFAPRLVAALPIDGFDHVEPGDEPGSLSDPAPADADADGESERPSGEAVLTALLEADVVEPAGEDVRLADDFREEWRREMRALRDLDFDGLARVADEQTAPSIGARADRSWGRSMLVLEGDSGVPTTLRRGVAVAELAAARALESRVESGPIRRAAGRPLRSLLDRCPLCDEELAVIQSSCCGEVTPIGQTPPQKLVCSSCNERFFTFTEPER